jgi:WD40 repeat protein
VTLNWPARLLGIVLLLTSDVAFTQSAPGVPPQEPQLRIDPGTHTGGIHSIGVDAACTLLATGSRDKTVRLWRLPEGRLINTLRPPIGPGDQGMVYAIALAPDATWVAVDGSYDDSGHASVLIFQAATGTVMTRLGPFPGTVQQLAVSYDGRYLAAALGGGEGVRIWERTGADLVSWRQIAHDQHYGGKDSNGASFDRVGTLYTTASDGRLRRYAPGYKNKPDSVTARGDWEPLSVAVHPSGDRVAVSFYDTAAVEVYDATSLNLRFAVNTRGVDNGSFFTLAWSADGTRLYAGGNYEKNGTFPILVWDQSGHGSARELEGPLNSVHQLLPCGDGIAMGASLATFGLLGPNGSSRLWREQVQADMRGKLFEDFASSGDGSRIRFGLKSASAEPVLFDLAAERMTDAPNQADDLHTTDEHALPIAIDSTGPKLGGRPIKLQPYDVPRSLAIAPDKKHFLLGGNWSLRAYDNKGAQQWILAKVPGTVWGLTIPRGGKVFVAAHSDGTLRWHRLSDGAELLALFVHAKDRRWVAWTPKGYYLASPGAEDLIGWHVNRGWDQAADFFPASRFRDQYYRPDIVHIVLRTLDQERAIEEANAAAKRKREAEDVAKRLPPVVNIVSPTDGVEIHESELVVEYVIRSPSRLPVTGVQAYIDGRPVGEGQKGFIPVSSSDNHLTLRVPVPRRDATLSLIALTEFGSSEPARIQLRWTGPKVQVQLPTLYALVIGIAKYADRNLNLNFAAKDADDFAAAFEKQEGNAYRQVVVHKLTDDKATERNIRLGLEWLKNNVKTGNDRAVFFYSGHGVTTPELASYLLPQDVDPTKLIATGLNKRVILDVLRGLPGRVLVFLDACHAAGGLEIAANPDLRRLDTVGLVNEFADAQNGIVSFVSSQGSELSYEDERWKNGAFTSALVEGLEGKGAGPDEKEILTVQLYLWLLKRVHSLTNDRQTPIMHSPPSLAPFAVALRRQPP